MKNLFLTKIRKSNSLCQFAITVLFVIVLIPSAYTHYWASVGTTWHYEQDDFYFEIQDLIKFESIGDTIIKGDTAKIIVESQVYNDTVSKHIYMKYADKKVYIFEPADETFKKLYDFNAVKNDTLMVYCRQGVEGSYINIVIDSVGTMVQGNDTLKVQYFKQLFGDNTECFMDNNFPIIERIGHAKFMFPQSQLADPPYGGALRCFEDKILGLYKTSDVPCGYVNSFYNKTNSLDISIVPNPTDGKVVVRSDSEIKQIELYTIQGKLIKQVNGVYSINIADLPNGNYLLKVFVGNTYKVEKISKQGL